MTTPIIPSLTGMTRPRRTSRASVPASIRSSLLMTSSVRRPVRCTERPYILYIYTLYSFTSPPICFFKSNYIIKRVVEQEYAVEYQIRKQGTRSEAGSGTFGTRYREPNWHTIKVNNRCFKDTLPTFQIITSTGRLALSINLTLRVHNYNINCLNKY